MPAPIQNSDRAVQAASFAGVLAALAGRGDKPIETGGRSEPEWLDDLEDEVTLLSYEHVLKTHGRCRPGDSAGFGHLKAADPMAPRLKELLESGALAAGKETGTGTPRRGSSTAIEDNRKRSSVTVRMSVAEAGRLQQRSAEAGLTVSAYLRSCAFEVDSLRAQVKEALAELRAAQQAAERLTPQMRPWWSRLFRRSRFPQPA